MEIFIATVFDIKDIQYPKRMGELEVRSDIKSDAADQLHKLADETYPGTKKYLEIRSFKGL